SLHSCSSSASLWNAIISAPAIGAQLLRVNTFRMNGLLSPASVWPPSAHVSRFAGARVGRTMCGHHVGDLDDRVDLGLGEDALSPGTLDMETENAQWGDPLPLAFGCVADQPVVAVDARH